VKLLKTALTNVNLGKPAGKLPFFIITGKKFLRNANIAWSFKAMPQK
jgi:hypothetical protein